MPLFPLSCLLPSSVVRANCGTKCGKGSESRHSHDEKFPRSVVPRFWDLGFVESLPVTLHPSVHGSASSLGEDYLVREHFWCARIASRHNLFPRCCRESLTHQVSEAE